MPELTVAMPARNTAEFIGNAVESVLGQEGVDLELIVVDDASSDETARVVEDFDDPRIRLLRNPTRRGIGHCHNRILRASRSPLIAHVDSDDFIVPGALSRMTSALQSSPSAGMAHCYGVQVDREGRYTREDFRRWYARRTAGRPRGYRRALLVDGMVVNHLRTYRRSALEAVGGFDETRSWAVDYEMALRLFDRSGVVCVPEPLYAIRSHAQRTTRRMRFENLAFWRSRLAIARRLRREGRVRFADDLYPLMGIGLLRVLRLPRAKRALRGAREILRELRAPLDRAVYGAMGAFGGMWLLPRAPRRIPPSAPRRIGYYLWKHPSSTFIQREIAALADAGFDVEVFADWPGDASAAGATLGIGVDRAHLLRPHEPERLARYRHRFRTRAPLRYARVFLFTASRRYGAFKSPKEDRSVFAHAVYLAGLLEDRGIGRIHSPWANPCAFTCLLASRLLGIPYSVQGRAYDLHRGGATFALREKFRAADFVVTNARFNAKRIRSELPARDAGKVHLVYEGIRPGDFPPPTRTPAPSGPARILTVARLTEEKGLPHLLRALRTLREWGYDFEAEVIGGTEEPRCTNHYVELMTLWRRLGLTERVSFPGGRDFAGVMEAYRRADVFALPCVRAGHGGHDITPNAMIEAMAMRLPVVSTRLGGIPEIIEDGFEGLLVRPGDDEALAKALATLLDSPGLRDELGARARRKVEERFDIDRNIGVYAALFRGDR